MSRALVALLVLVVGGCEGAEARRTSASAPPASSSAAPLGSKPPPPALPPAPARVLGCRALAVTGGVRLDGKPVAVGELLDGNRWLELDRGGSISLRHTESARELAAHGPALLLACAGGEEEVVLGRGRLTTAAGPGARPGAQVLVHTPLGTVSYGDARVVIQASRSQVEVSVGQGQAWVQAAGGARRTGPQAPAGPNGKATLRGTGEPSALVRACEAEAESAEQKASAVLSPDAGPDAGSLGERAAAHLGARQAARRACGSARAAVSTGEDAARRGFEQRLERAERRWRTVGGGPTAAPSPSAG